MKATLAVAFTGIAVSAVTALVVTSYEKISNKILEPAAELGITASVDHMDQDYSVVFADKYTLTPWQVAHSSNASLLSANVSTLVKQFVDAGAIYPRAQTVTVRIVNKVHERTLRITGVRLVELQRLRPLDGTLINLPPQGGVNTMQMAFNLDEAGDPIAHRVDQGKVGASFFTHQEIELKPNETVTLKLLVATGKYSASFKIGIDYLSTDSKSTKTRLVDHGGKPFRLTAHSCTQSKRLQYQRLYGLELPDGAWRLHEVASLRSYDEGYCNFVFERSVLLWAQG